MTDNPAYETRQQRIDAIAARLRVSRDLHIARVEDALGMTPRRDSPDAGHPLQALQDAGQAWDAGLDAGAEELAR